MAARSLRLFLIFGILISLMSIHPGKVKASPEIAASVVMIAPSVCPSTGCAAGQSVDFKVDYDLGAYLPTLVPNVQICVYTPIIWSAYLFHISTIGDVSGANYTPGISYCSFEITPDGYNLLGGAAATLSTNQFGDGLNFGFRIGGSALGTGSVLVRVLEQTSSSVWTRSSQAFSSVKVVPTGASVFVANDAPNCGTNSPCYINSFQDLADGYGTGLKDAVDARLIPSSITIVGNYTIKDHTVVVQTAHVIQGSIGSSLTYNGSACTLPMLKLTGGATLRNLTIRDGSCVSTSRDLVVIEGLLPVLIEYSTLTGGQDALQITNLNTGNVQIQFNQITGNKGYAIWLGATNSGDIEALGNNLYGNRSGVQVECNNHGRVEHNYWGAGIAAISASSNCSVTEIKRLGAPALLNIDGPGVSAGRLTVNDTQKTYFKNSIGFQRSGGTDFDLYVVNHGSGSNVNIPFTSSSPSNLTPCSPYWDIFLGENSVLNQGTILSVFFKYDLTSGCVATISSTRYCAQPEPVDMTIYPLYWYDPVAYPTSMEWKTTGSTGQTTACILAEQEIRVDIDASDRPGLDDLSFLPFVVGLPGQPTAVRMVDYGVSSPGLEIGGITSLLILMVIGGWRLWLLKGRRHA